MAKTFQTTLANRASAEDLVRDLIDAIRDRQEARGENYQDASAYTLGYLSSVLAGVIANSPKGRAEVNATLAYVKGTK